MMVLFQVNEKDTTVFQTRVAGVSYEDRQKYIELLHEKTPIFLQREGNNPYDENAIAVMATIQSENQKIGYLPRGIAKEIAPRMDKGEFIFVQLLDKKQEEYHAIDYEQMKEKNWHFTGVVVGIMY